MDIWRPSNPSHLIPRNLFPMESKSAIARTVRRPYSRTPYRALSTRMNRMVKLNKMQNPLHCFIMSAAAQFVSANTTTPLVELYKVQEGDAYDNRFGTKITARRVRFSINVCPTATTPVNTVARICVFRAQIGTGVGATIVDTNTSSTVIANNTMTRVLYDVTKIVPLSSAAGGVQFKGSVKLSEAIRFNGSANTAAVGEILWIACISNVVTGATAPTVSGWVESWFSP